MDFDPTEFRNLPAFWFEVQGWDQNDQPVIKWKTPDLDSVASEEHPVVEELKEAVRSILMSVRWEGTVSFDGCRGVQLDGDRLSEYLERSAAKAIAMVLSPVYGIYVQDVRFARQTEHIVELIRRRLVQEMVMFVQTSSGRSVRDQWDLHFTARQSKEIEVFVVQGIGDIQSISLNVRLYSLGNCFAGSIVERYGKEIRKLTIESPQFRDSIARSVRQALQAKSEALARLVEEI